MTTDISGSEIEHPTHDMTLSDGVHPPIGLMLSDVRGKDYPLAIRRSSFPRQSTKIATTNNKYSDLEPPYYAIMQDDWTGGRGGLTFEDDVTRFNDSCRVWTDQLHQIILGGQETYANGYKLINQFQPGNMNWQNIIDSEKNYFSHSFVAASTKPHYYMLWLKYHGNPDHITIYLAADSSGHPGSQITNSIYTLHPTDLVEGISYCIFIDLTTHPTITQGNTYWIVVYTTEEGTNEENCWEIGVDPDHYANTKYYNGGWFDNDKELYYRVVYESDLNLKFFEYKRQMYAANLNKFGAVNIYRNGDRGAAGDNTSYLNKLIDTDKAWTPDEWIGCSVLITKGPGSDESQPWRLITDNDATSLTVSPNWERIHTTDSEYVILGSNKWTSISLSNVPSSIVTDVTVANEIVYLARGTDYLARYCERNLSGVWSESNDVEEHACASKLLSLSTPDGWILWGGVNSDPIHKTAVWKANVPNAWSDTCDLYSELLEIHSTKNPWDEQSLESSVSEIVDNNLRFHIYPGYAGLIASKQLSSIDFTNGRKIGFLMKSSVEIEEDDLTFVYDDTPRQGKYYVPDNLWYASTEILPTKIMYFRPDGKPIMVHYYDNDGGTGALPDKWHRIYNVMDFSLNNEWHITLAAEDYLYLSFDQPSSVFYFMLNAWNGNTVSLSAEIWNGKDWESISIDDATVGFKYNGWFKLTGSIANWNPGCAVGDTTNPGQGNYLAIDQWHIRIKASGATTELSFIDYKIYGSGITETPRDRGWVGMDNVYDDRNSDRVFDCNIYHNGAIYIGAPKPFYIVRFILPDEYHINDHASHLHMYYFDGEDWIEGSGYTDYTSSGSATLHQSGYYTTGLTTTIPEWQKGCNDWEASHLSSDLYWMKFVIHATGVNDVGLSEELQINKILVSSFNQELIQYWTQDRAKDGDDSTTDFVTFKALDYWYVMFSEKFNVMDIDIDTTYRNTTNSTLSGQYWNGREWVSIDTLYDGTEDNYRTLYKDGQIYWDQFSDWEKVEVNGIEGYAVRFTVSNETTKVSFKSIYIYNSYHGESGLGAMPANQWQWIECNIDPSCYYMQSDRIISIGLRREKDLDNQYIYIHGGIHLIDEYPKFIPIGNAEENIVSMEGYGDERENCWVITDGNIWEIQTQNNDAPVALPLREIRSLRSESNGRAHTVSNVYLCFNLSSHFERYYQHNLDDVGVDRDEGLPEERRGIPSCAISYPGRIFMAIDAGDTGYSSILERKDSGWHEVYRAPNTQRIRDIRLQVIPGLIDRLWISQGSDILWIPLPDASFNPLNDSNFRYINEGHLITGWYTLSFLDVAKIFVKLKLFVDSLVQDEQYIEVDYQLDNGTLITPWTSIEDQYNTIPFQENLLSEHYEVRGKRIRFRYRFYTTDNTKTPVLKASILEVLMRFPVKYSYTCSIRIEDHPADNSGTEDMNLRAEDIANLLDEWADGPYVLTWKCPYTIYDNKKVFIEPPGMRPIELDSPNQVEKHLAEIVLMEI